MNKRPRRIELVPDDSGSEKKINQKVIAKAKYIEEEFDKSLKNVHSIGSFLKKGATLIALFGMIVLVGTIYDSFITISSMFQNSTTLAILYSSLILVFVSMLSHSVIKNFLEYRKFKRIDRLQEKGDALAKQSSNEIYQYAKELIKLYKTHTDSLVANGAKKLEVELDSLLESEVMDRINELVLHPLDKIASDKISKYATQTALSTAISPVALIDAFLILSRSHVMVKEIAKVYGFRANWIAEVSLMKKVFVTLAFASVTDILANHSSDFFGTSMLSKISVHSAQGIANGILVARIGLSVIKSVRPTRYGLKSSGFFKTIYRSITKQLFSRNK